MLLDFVVLMDSMSHKALHKRKWRSYTQLDKITTEIMDSNETAPEQSQISGRIIKVLNIWKHILLFPG